MRKSVPNIQTKCSPCPDSSHWPWWLICPTLNCLYSSIRVVEFKFPKLVNHYSKLYLMSSLNLFPTAVLVICIAFVWTLHFLNTFLLVTAQNCKEQGTSWADHKKRMKAKVIPWLLYIQDPLGAGLVWVQTKVHSQLFLWACVSRKGSWSTQTHILCDLWHSTSW